MGNILSSTSEDIQNNNKYKTHAFIYSSFIIHMNEFGKDSMLVLHFCIVMNIHETSSSHFVTFFNICIKIGEYYLTALL